MPRILHLTRNLAFGRIPRLLEILLPGLGGEHRLTVLGGPTPAAARLEALGFPAVCLGWNRPLDPRAFLRLRGLAGTSNPDVVQCWGFAALRAASAAGLTRHRGVLLGGVLPPSRRRPLSLADRLLLRATGGRVLSSTPWPDGIPTALIPPAAIPEGTAGPDVPLPSGSPTILVPGPLEQDHGIRDALWTFDILAFVYPNLQLLVPGTGPDAADLHRFGDVLRARDRVFFLGPVPAMDPLLARVDLVWVPSRADRGQGAVLDAMAAGKAVIASRYPRLRAVIDDRVTGFLVPPGDKLELARTTRELLESPEQRASVAALARRHVRERFSPAAAREAYGRALGLP